MPNKPKPDTEPDPYTRDNFHALLKKAATPQVPKPVQAKKQTSDR